MVAAPAARESRPTLAVGKRLCAGDQPFAVLLDDGTPVYLNRDTAVFHECCGELTLTRGEIYIERRMPPAAETAAKLAPEKPQPGFVVNLPNGEVVIWNAKVDLRIEGEGVRISVVRGKAFVDETPVRAGQSFVYYGDKRLADAKTEAVDRSLAAIAWTCPGWHVPEAQRVAAPTEEHSPLAGDEPPVRDWIFIVDCSGDRTPRLARTQIEIVRNLMNLAEDGDTAIVISAGVRPRVLAPYRLKATPETTARMVEMLAATHLVGGLDLQRAIDTAQFFIRASGSPVLVFVGAGRPSLGRRDPKAFLARIPDSVRTIGIDVGPEDLSEMMVATAGRPGGRAAKIDPEQDIRTQVIGLLDSMDQPSAATTSAKVKRRRGTLASQLWSLAGASDWHADLVCRNSWFAVTEPHVWAELAVALWQWDSGRIDEAYQRLKRLSADPAAQQCPLVWRLAAKLADARGRFGLRDCLLGKGPGDPAGGSVRGRVREVCGGLTTAGSWPNAASWRRRRQGFEPPRPRASWPMSLPPPTVGGRWIPIPRPLVMRPPARWLISGRWTRRGST